MLWRRLIGDPTPPTGDVASLVAFGTNSSSFSSGGPHTVTFSTTNSIPLGWTLLVLVWTGEATTLAIADPDNVSLDGTNATKAGTTAEAINAGQPGGVNWDHKWTRWYIENWTSGALTNASVGWTGTGFTNNIHVLVFAVPGGTGATYGATGNAQFTTSTLKTLGNGAATRYHVCAATSTDGTGRSEGSIVATSNASGLIENTRANPLAGFTRQIHYAVYSPNGASTDITVTLPGSDTGASFVDFYVEY